MSKLRNILKFTFIIFATLFMFYYLFKNWHQLQNYQVGLNTSLFVLSFILLWIAIGSAIFMNRLIFANIAHAPFGFWQMFRIYNLANLGRYLPGKLWNIFGLYYMVNEYGVGKRQTTLAVIASEVGYKGSAILIGLLYFFFSPALKQYIPLLILLLISLLIMVHPKVLSLILNHLLRLLKKQPIIISFRYSTILKYLTMYIIVWALHSLAFFVFVSSITSTKEFNVVHFFTIMPLCWVIGYIAVFAPGGIGVREGMLVLLLSEILPAEVALVIAISQRIWFIIVEGLNAVIALLIRKNVDSIKELC